MLHELRHPNIVEMIAVDRDQGGFWDLMLEWVSENLESIIGRGVLTWDDFWERSGRPLLDAVVYVQKRRIAHRDIKPKNILITEVGVPTPQIILRWLVQQDDVVALSRTANPGRIAENLTVFDFELGEDEMGAISDIDKDQQPDRQPGRTGSRVGCFLIGRS